MTKTMDDMLSRKITIKQGIEMGLITARVLSDCDLFIRVQTIMENEKIPKTHAIEKVAEMCRVNEKTVWRSYSFTDKLMSVV
jgi:methenyltetrahydromethanopterin cyclohydrolase